MNFNLKKTALLSALFGAALGFSNASAQAQTVSLGSLLDPNIQLPATGVPIFFDAFLADNAGQPTEDFNLFFLWNVTGGSVDLRGGIVPGANDPINGRFVDLDGGTPGRFETRLALPLVAGQTYNVSFSYFSTDGKPNSARAAFGGKVFSFGTRSRTPRLFSRNFTFPTTTTSTLAFRDLGRDGNGIGLDNVVISLIPLPGPLNAPAPTSNPSAPQS